jgi:hypothetical protein
MNQEHKVIKCPVCNKEFSSKKALAQHSTSKAHPPIKLAPKITCPKCNKHFETKRSLLQHQKAVVDNHKKVIYPICKNNFTTKRSLKQHQQMHKKGTIISKKSKVRANYLQKELVLYENLSWLERIKNKLRKLLKKPTVILLDECVEKDNQIIAFFESRYNILFMPLNLRTYKDHELRLVLLEKLWGIISKDYEMCVLSHKKKVNPVYYLKETDRYRTLIRLGNSNF